MPAFLGIGIVMDVKVRLSRTGDLDPSLARRYYAVLDAADRDRVDRLPPGRRGPMLLARGLARIELARVLGLAPGALRFRRAPGGKPAVAGAPQLCFNLSHSGEWVVLAWLAQPSPVPSVGLGVDLERRQAGRDAERLAARCFGQAEGSLVAALPAAAAEARFRDRWTLTEAWVKARGGSLARILGTSLIPELPPGARCGRGRAAAGGVASWRLLTPTPELTLALWLDGAVTLRTDVRCGLPFRCWLPLRS